VAQDVGRRPVTAEDRHQNKVSPCANYAGQSGIGVVLRETLFFPSSVSFYERPIHMHSSVTESI
jgi:hypothetical protein